MKKQNDLKKILKLLPTILSFLGITPSFSIFNFDIDINIEDLFN